MEIRQHSAKPQFIREHIQRIIDHLSDAPGSRKRKRYPYSPLIKCTTIGEDLMPTGKEFTARGRDLSATGIRIIHSDRVATGQRIAMELTTVDEKQIVVIGRVQWCKPSEFGQDKIELGVKFLAFG